MKRSEVNAVETIGNDSFLDVVTNVVGILIVLVIVAGLQAGRALQNGAAQAAASELAAPQATEHALTSDIQQLDAQRQYVQKSAAARDAERLYVATAIAMTEQELNTRRGKLDATQRERYDMERALADAKAALARQSAERESLAGGKPPAIELQSFSTPISKTVVGKQVHVRLSKGCVAIVPLDELVDEAKQATRRRMWKPEDMRGFTDEVGPIGGFRLRYVMEIEVDATRTRAAISMKEAQVVPESWQVGEPVAKALVPQSEFRTALGNLDPQDTTVTVWTYPESFAEYRAVTGVLHELGFTVAGRPLPDGVPIGSSSRGTKSAAQ
jgi:hypothetical protein